MRPFRSGNFDCSFYTLANFYLGEVQSPLLLLSDLPGIEPSARQAQRASDIQSRALPEVNPRISRGLCGARFSSKVLEKVDAGPASSGHPLKKLVTVYSRQ
jgi:hypothetical protein